MVSFRSPVPWRDEFSGNLLILCSDERFAEATMEFARHLFGISWRGESHLRGSQLSGYDVMAVAGGPAFIVDGEENLIRRLALLVHAHRVDRILLVTHAECGYYRSRFGEGQDISARQKEDAQQAVRILHQMWDPVSARAFFASVEGEAIVFAELGG